MKIAIVLVLTRNALGVQQVPPNIVIYAIALVTTVFIMTPVFGDMHAHVNNDISQLKDIDYIKENYSSIIEPLRNFMRHNTDPELHQKMMLNAEKFWTESYKDSINVSNMLILIPSFVLSELESAFKMGVLIYIPFLIVDLLVSNVLLALGMQMVSPMTVSLPLKILLFVMVSGWTNILDVFYISYSTSV